MHELALDTPRSDTPRQRPGAAPHRRCVVTGRVLPRQALIRFVVAPDDTVVPDLAERLPGRGLWLTGRSDIVAQACAGGAFRRAARRPVTPLVGPGGEDLATVVDRQLAQRCREALGLARRAGQLIVGFDQVRLALKNMSASADARRNSAILLSAADAADDGRNKLRALAERLRANGATITQLVLFDQRTMGQAIGRDQVVHALVKADGSGDRVPAAIWRLAAYRGLIPVTGTESAESALVDVVEMD